MVGLSGWSVFGVGGRYQGVEAEEVINNYNSLQP